MKNWRKSKNNSNSINIVAVANDLIFFIYTLPTFSGNLRTNGSVIISYQYLKLSTFHRYIVSLICSSSLCMYVSFRTIQKLLNKWTINFLRTLLQCTTSFYMHFIPNKVTLFKNEHEWTKIFWGRYLERCIDKGWKGVFWWSWDNIKE